jgi:alanine or glycine:cation symporter, AGCS family
MIHLLSFKFVSSLSNDNLLLTIYLIIIIGMFMKNCRVIFGFLVGLFSSSAFSNESLLETINESFGMIVEWYAPVLFFEIPFIKLPFILFVMVSGGIFFTFRYGFINIKLYKHALDVVRGKYDNPDDEGEISHFQALTSALSATVGLGNIAGVAVAIQLGGPGAVFWLWVVAFFGMSMKFSSCTFAQLYRQVKPDGSIIGGPMVYLKKGLGEDFNLKKLGAFFGFFYAFMTIMASFGGGNLFQGNQAFELLSNQFPVVGNHPWVVGIILSISSGVVLLGGIKRIGDVTSKLVPLMCAFYCVSCLVIILSNVSLVPSLFVSIFTEAFNPSAIYSGGFIGVLIQGVKRASFSNEAGLGSAAIAHAAAKTDEPVREGVVAMIGPTIDTHLVCTMTSLAILITGAHLDPSVAGKGAQITANAFATLGTWMPYLLTGATIIFAYSTIISWSYYGEKGVEYLVGAKYIPAYRFVYCLVIILGPVLKLGNVIDFSDLMLLSMAFPNIFGMILLSGKVKEKLDNYVTRYKNGEMKTYS